jgi:hypothetical protein
LNRALSSPAFSLTWAAILSRVRLKRSIDAAAWAAGKESMVLCGRVGVTNAGMNNVSVSSAPWMQPALIPTEHAHRGTCRDSLVLILSWLYAWAGPKSACPSAQVLTQVTHMTAKKVEGRSSTMATSSGYPLPVNVW